MHKPLTGNSCEMADGKVAFTAYKLDHFEWYFDLSSKTYTVAYFLGETWDSARVLPPGLYVFTG